ncbi:PAS domain-containing protein [Tamlana flava]|uniref:PAS domain-containing protein n=1 Tax=Tamlana flava TaxID=3158572 RepID=UPI00351B9F1E
MEKIFSNTYDGIAILTLDGGWIKVNDIFCDILVYNRDELFNMNIENIVLGKIWL